ncbi:MAG: hypothetical protein AAGI54_03305 [Planctomycetota bacterium]
MVVTLAMLALIAAGRMAIEPSDLYDNEQPLTISYTADMLLNGHWVVYYGFTGELLTKPPLFNWVAAPFVAVAGFGAEWAHKAPAWLGLAVVFAATVAMGRWTLPRAHAEAAKAWLLSRSSARRASGGVPEMPASGVNYPYAFIADWRGLAWAGGLMAVSSYLGIKLMYLARPDGVMIGCLAVAWWLGTIMVVRESGERARWGVAAGFWAAVGLAGLAKGVPALIPVIYVLLLGGLRGWARGERWSWRWASEWGVWWGLPLASGMVGAWLIAGELASPGLLKRLVVDEVGAKASGGGWWTPLMGLAMSPGYFVARVLPWSVLALLGVGHVMWHWRGWRAWVVHPAFPAIAWLGVVIVFFVPAADRGDYLAPAMPAAGVLAAFWLGHHAYRLRSAAAVAVAAGCVGLAIVGWRVSIAEPYGENTHRFVADLGKVLDGRPIVLVETGYNPLPTLLGVHPRGKRPSDDELAAAGWAIAPKGKTWPAPEGAEPLFASRPLPEVSGKRAGSLVLWRLKPATPARE